MPNGTIALFQRFDLDNPGTLVIAVTRPTAPLGDMLLSMAVRSAISEVQYSNGVAKSEITCLEDDGRQFCSSTLGRDTIVGWAWADSGRVYLVTGVVTTGRNHAANLEEILDVVDSMEAFGFQYIPDVDHHPVDASIPSRR